MNTTRAPGESCRAASSIEAARIARSESCSTLALSSSIAVSRMAIRLVWRSAFSVRLTAIRCAQVPNCESPR